MAAALSNRSLMRALAVILVAAVAVAGAAALRDTSDVAPSAGYRQPTTEADAAVRRLTAAPRSVARVTVDAAGGGLIRADQIAVAGRRRPATVRAEAHGIRCPDGTHLPLLNGVENAPAIIRAPEHGPLPPVVAIVVDVAGFDWYEHADGSMTTCRPQFVTDADGHRAIQVITVHSAGATANDAVAELPPEPTAPQTGR